MKRERQKIGSVVFDKRIKTWNFIWWESGKRRSRVIGSIKKFPTKSSAWKAAKPLVTAMESQVKEEGEQSLKVRDLVNSYRAEKMPTRASTRRGYECWLQNHILPRWGESPLIELQPRPVELWLQSINLQAKSKLHIRGLLSILWDYAMWRGDIPTRRNPMELVTIKGAGKRVRKPRTLTVDEFHTLLGILRNDPCLRTFVLVSISFGLRISETLGLKWVDINWLDKTINLNRGVVKQVVDGLKTDGSEQTMVIGENLLTVLMDWKQTTQFSALNDWVFASPTKLGRQPFSYMHIWKKLSKAASKAQIAHVSSHSFRHTYRSWLDSVGTPVGVQQKLMRHSDVRTTMNFYGDAMTEDMRQAHEKVIRLALPQQNGL